MKILGPCFLMSVSLLNVAAQETPTAPLQDSSSTRTVRSADRDRLQMARLERDMTITDNRDSYCAYIRAYRVKREARGSDIVRPAGYTTCVPSTRFTMKSTVQTVTTDPSTEE